MVSAGHKQQQHHQHHQQQQLQHESQGQQQQQQQLSLGQNAEGQLPLLLPQLLPPLPLSPRRRRSSSSSSSSSCWCMRATTYTSLNCHNWATIIRCQL